MSPSKEWINIDSTARTIKILTTDTSLRGVSETFTVTSTLNNSAASSNSDYTFTVTLENPCFLTAPPNPSPLAYAIGDGAE